MTHRLPVTAALFDTLGAQARLVTEIGVKIEPRNRLGQASARLRHAIDGATEQRDGAMPATDAIERGDP